MTWQELAKQMDRVQEVDRLVAEFRVYFDGPPDNLVRVKVYEDASGRFTGFSDYEVQAKGAASPYRSIASQTSIDAALADSLCGLSVFAGPESQWFKDPNF